MESSTKPAEKFLRIFIVIILVAILALWFFYTPDGLLGKADAVGYAVCHRINVRSFFIENRQMPMCARCTGMYLGTACALIFQSVASRRRGGMPSKGVLAIMATLAVIWLIDGANSYVHLFPNMRGLYAPNNLLRLLTGSGIGIVAAVLLFPAFQQTIWSDWQPEPAIGGIKQMGILILLTLFIDYLVLLNQPYVLLAVALISTAFVFVLLAMVYGMLLVILFKIENRWSRLRDAFYVLAAGLVIAVLQIGVMDWVRYVFTGSWQGILFQP